MAPDRIVSFLDEARTAAVHEWRRRTQDLRHQEQSEATLVGTLVDLAELGCEVSAKTSAGNSHRGKIKSVGTDFVALGIRCNTYVLIALQSLAAVQTQANDHRPPATGQRESTIDLSLHDVLAEAAEEEPWVNMTLATGETICGYLCAVGADILTVRPEGEGAGTFYLSESLLAEALFLSASK